MPAINAVCPVMDVEIDPEDPRETREYDGRTIGFCCGVCPSQFEDDPEQYMEKMQENPEEYLVDA